MTDGDPLRDPNFPDRPQHPDFWRISEVVLQLDSRLAEENLPDEEIQAQVSEVVDLDSLQYMAAHRSGQCLKQIMDDMELPEPVRELLTPIIFPIMAASWSDAFLMGATFQERGGHQ